MSTNLFIIFPDNRKRAYSVTPSMTLRNLINKACSDVKINDPENYILKNNNAIMDLTTTVRFLGLPSGIKLNLVKNGKNSVSKSASKVIIALQTEEGGRLRDEFLSTTTLWNVLLHFEKKSNGKMNITRRCEKEDTSKGNSFMKMIKSERYVYVQPVCVIMNKEFGTIDLLKKTTLRDAGITGNSMIRLLKRLTNKTLSEMLPIIEDYNTEKPLPSLSNNSVISSNEKISQLTEEPSSKTSDKKETVTSESTSVTNIKKETVTMTESSLITDEKKDSVSMAESSLIENEKKESKETTESSPIPNIKKDSVVNKNDNELINKKVKLDSETNNEKMEIIENEKSDKKDLMEIDNEQTKSNENIEMENNNIKKEINSNEEIEKLNSNIQKEEKTNNENKLTNKMDIDHNEEEKIDQINNEIDNNTTTESIDRNIKFYNPPKNGSVMPNNFELPNSFFELSSSELKLLITQQRMKIDKQNNAPLKTKAMREQEDEAKRKKYPKCRIRVKFPNQSMIEITFLSNEPLSLLYNEVQNVLYSKEKPFYLYTTPPKSILSNNELTFWKAGLAPSSNVFFNWENEKDKISEKSYLLPEYQKLSCDFIKETPENINMLKNDINKKEIPNNGNGIRLGSSYNQSSKSNKTNSTLKSNSDTPSTSTKKKTLNKIPKWLKI